MNRANGGRRLTSKEAARVLGVSEASVKRWADSGLLPMEKTAGGHRRFRPEDVAAVRRAGPTAAEAPLQGRRLAPLNQTAQPPELAPAREAALLEETFRALLDGRDEDLSALLVGRHLEGHTVGRISDAFLCAAMRRVGDLWHAGELTVAQEHVATRTALVALQGLQAARRGAAADERVRALCCSVEDDFHELPLRLAALTLEASGVAVFNLGPSTPFNALAEAVQRFRPELVCVSSTVLLRLDRAAYEYAGFNKAARRTGAAIVLGGAGFREESVRKRLPADLHAESFRQLEEFVGTLAAAGLDSD
jgi:MerR family transcriptional regulator, light-induced transcriptional regulator